MPYVTSVERVDLANVFMVQLSKLCDSEVPQETEWRIRRLPYEQLEKLGTDLLDFRCLEDLLHWLDQNDNAND